MSSRTWPSLSTLLNTTVIAGLLMEIMQGLTTIVVCIVQQSLHVVVCQDETTIALNTREDKTVVPGRGPLVSVQENNVNLLAL